MQCPQRTICLFSIVVAEAMRTVSDANGGDTIARFERSEAEGDG